jgi:hypothetical protein
MRNILKYDKNGEKMTQEEFKKKFSNLDNVRYNFFSN